MKDASAEPKWTFGGWNKLLDPEGYPGCTPPWGTIRAGERQLVRPRLKVTFLNAERLEVGAVGHGGLEAGRLERGGNMRGRLVNAIRL